MREVLAAKPPAQVVVICGKNARLEARLKEMPPEGAPLTVVGFTRAMAEWMAAADLFVGKAGGLSSAEALARGLALVIVNPIPGQEERNADHFLEEGVAIRCNNLPALSYKIETLLSDPGAVAADGREGTAVRPAARRGGYCFDRPQRGRQALTRFSAACLPGLRSTALSRLPVQKERRAGGGGCGLSQSCPPQ